MIDISNVADKDYVLEHLWEFVHLYNSLDKMLESIKTDCKSNKEWLDLPSCEARYSSYSKMIPIDLNVILQKYPLDKFPECYNISLAAKAGEIIMEPELVDYKLTETVSFKIK